MLNQPLGQRSTYIADPGSPYVATFQCLMSFCLQPSIGSSFAVLHFYDSKQRPGGRATFLLSVRSCCITWRCSLAPWQPLSGTRFSCGELSIKRVQIGTIHQIFTIQTPFSRDWIALQHMSNRSFSVEHFCATRAQVWSKI